MMTYFLQSKDTQIETSGKNKYFPHLRAHNVSEKIGVLREN